MKRHRPVLLAALVGLIGTACAGAEETAPRCEPGERLAIVAQSIPGAAYVPCVAELPPGWSVVSFDVDSEGTRFELRSDRAERPVEVELAGRCDVRGSVPVTPRAEGVRTYLRVAAISPRYSGEIHDVFPGGCVTYRFDFERGPHIGLTDELGRTIGLYSRRELRQELRDDLGITL